MCKETCAHVLQNRAQVTRRGPAYSGRVAGDCEEDVYEEALRCFGGTDVGRLDLWMGTFIYGWD